MRESEKALNIAVFVECELPNGSKHADILFELIQKSMYPLMEAKRYVDHLLYTYSQNGTISFSQNMMLSHRYNEVVMKNK